VEKITANRVKLQVLEQQLNTTPANYEQDLKDERAHLESLLNEPPQIQHQVDYIELLLYPESRSDDRMPAGRSEAGYRKKVPEDYRMTGRPREDASTTRVTCRVNLAIWPIERRG
jgi:hypothetical protein